MQTNIVLIRYMLDWEYHVLPKNELARNFLFVLVVCTLYHKSVFEKPQGATYRDAHSPLSIVSDRRFHL